MPIIYSARMLETDPFATWGRFSTLETHTGRSLYQLKQGLPEDDVTV